MPPAEQPPRAASLPAADGVFGHLRHTWAVIGILRTWRRQYQALDDALRDAVQVRDLRLAELGEAAYAVRAELQGELIAFTTTLDDLTGEQQRAEEGVQRAGIDHAAAEAERTETLGRHGAEVKAARSALTDPERRLAEMDARIDALERDAAARAGQRTLALERLERLTASLAAPPGPTTDDTERDRMERERAEVQARIDSFDAATRTATEQRATLIGPRDSLREEVERLSAALTAAKDAHREARRALDAKVEATKASVHAAENQLQTATARRRAVAIDLARAILQQPGLSMPGRPAAEAAIEEIDQLRTARAAIDTEWSAFDGSAARRTGLAIGGILVALIVLWIAL